MKVAVVTGASSGIGYSVTKELASNGYVVYACARRLTPIEPLVKEFGDKVKPYQLDISVESQIVEFKNFLAKELPDGKLDLLYNNAGQACCYAASDAPSEEVMKIFQVNVFGHMNITREFIPLLIKAKGTIVFTGSIAGEMPIPFLSVYCASKGAIHQYARTVSLELKPFGVRVINAITGGVETAIAGTRVLPEYSIYNTKEGIEASEVVGDNTLRHTGADDYAKQMLKDILSTKDPVDVYRGAYAGIMYYMSLFVPQCLIRKVIYSESKMNKFDAAVQKNNNKKGN